MTIIFKKLLLVSLSLGVCMCGFCYHLDEELLSNDTSSLHFGPGPD